MVNKISTGLIALMLTGCSFMGIGESEFACKGGIDGVHCLSAREVYSETNNSDHVKTIKASDEDNGSIDGQQAVASGHQSVAVPSITQSIPIRTQAKVMRIWTAPWEDEAGDLHAEAYMYTEIENRKWNLGSHFNSPNVALSPLTH